MAASIELAEGLTNALNLEEPEERDSALDSWKSESRESLISLFEVELNSYLDHLREQMARPGAIESGRRKSEQNVYELEVTVKATYACDEDGQVIRRRPAAVATLAGASSHAEGPNNQVDDYDDDDWDGDDGRSPNDDRSDSMNPNNDAYQAAQDNRSDQMNPNNDAYGSSRGR